MEAQILASELLGKYGVFLSQLSVEIGVFQLHLVTTTYGDVEGIEGKPECCTLVLTIVQVIWW